MTISMRTFLAGPALAASAILPTAASAAPMPQHVRGTISAVTATSLTVATANGPVSLALAPDLKVAGVLPATADSIVPGTFVGTANVPGAGAARALEVVVFPDAMRGTGEGRLRVGLALGRPAFRDDQRYRRETEADVDDECHRQARGFRSDAHHLRLL